jgi:hypothetical protein
MKNTIIATTMFCLLTGGSTIAQDTSKLSFTTGVGILKPNSSLGTVLQSGVAFNSGVELALKKKFFVQATFDFNTLRYDQRVTDGSPFLFQNTNSSLLMIGVNGGKNFSFNKHWTISGYSGAGYLNIGEPRASVLDGRIIKQSIKRTGGVFGRAGIRVAYNTGSKLLHTLYADVNGWTSPAEVQGLNVSGLGFFVGTRMPM